jgi:oligopeptide transport system substrate-binding protein
MNKLKLFFSMMIFVLLLAACTSPQAQPEQPIATTPPESTSASEPTAVPPTETYTPEPTFTPSPTPVPGKQVFPIDSLAEEIPWLPMDKSNVPGINYVSFNTEKPPFNNVLVRQAFSYAIDREAITEMAIKYYARDARPATVFTPPEIMGRDLYGDVGISFDPQRAKELFAESGYSDPSAFPSVTYLVNASGETAPGARLNMANAMAKMWQEHLGVTVNVVVEGNWGEFLDRLRENPPEIYRLAWSADYNDPDNFLGDVFHSDADSNFGRFSSTEFDELVDSAKLQRKYPEKRQTIYIQAEYILCEEQAAVIPLYFQTYP